MLNETFSGIFKHREFLFCYSKIKSVNHLIFAFFSVAYSADEVIYVWQLPKKKAVDYEGKLQLSQFDIMETAFRGLNYSRGNNSESYYISMKHFRINKLIF